MDLCSDDRSKGVEKEVRDGVLRISFCQSSKRNASPDLPDISFRKRKTDNCLFDSHFPHSEFI